MKDGQIIYRKRTNLLEIRVDNTGGGRGFDTLLNSPSSNLLRSTPVLSQQGERKSQFLVPGKATNEKNVREVSNQAMEKGKAGNLSVDSIKTHTLSNTYFNEA